jgi:hypothetical protein
MVTTPTIQTTLTTVSIDINVPIYNRTTSGVNSKLQTSRISYISLDCCGMPGKFPAVPVTTNFTSMPSQLLTMSNPIVQGLIGTANCSASPNNSLLCVCGGNLPFKQNDCYTGENNAHIYLIEFCNATSSVCSVRDQRRFAILIVCFVLHRCWQCHFLVIYRTWSWGVSAAAITFQQSILSTEVFSIAYTR